MYRQIEIGYNVQFIALGAVMSSVLFLSIGGVYALLSFTVNRKRQEIGIRSARSRAGLFSASFVER